MMVIIGEGSLDDPQSLRLDSRKGSHIPNVKRKQMAPPIARERVRVHMEAHPRIRLISMGTTYNCYGMVLAARRTCIYDENDIRWILEDDDYNSLPWDPATWELGDVVLYTNDDKGKRISHMGLIASIRYDLETANCEVRVLSTWGEGGEYLHDIEDVPEILGSPFSVVSQRFPR